MHPIAALATPHAAGGIAVVRISGDNAIDIAAHCFRGVKDPKSMTGYTATYGEICDITGKTIDDGILTVFRTPHSYTGEDSVEISCHGGITVTERLLDALYAQGASPAEAGEFTKRAYLAGKMTLTEAEAVLDIIGATNERELAFAHASQKGALFHRITKIRDKLLHLLGDLAAWADYPEDDIPAVTSSSLSIILSELIDDCTSLLVTYDYGRILHSGISAAIVGRPNVGKSTLFNALAREERSIVTPVPGTTRDIVEEEIRLGSVTLRLSDTAGLRETEDSVEKIGVTRARNQLEKADLILAVFDATMPPSPEEIQEYTTIQNKPIIVIINKIDLNPDIDITAYLTITSHVVPLSAQTGEGIAKLEETIASLFSHAELTPEMGILTNARQKQCLESALSALKSAEIALNNGEQFDAITVELNEASDALLSLTGERTTTAVVDDVFSRFCVGK